MGNWLTNIYRDGSVVKLVSKDGAWVRVQIRLDLPHEIGDLVSGDGLVTFDMWGELATGPMALQEGDRVRIMETRENMRLVYFGLERLPQVADTPSSRTDPR